MVALILFGSILPVTLSEHSDRTVTWNVEYHHLVI